MFSYHLATSIKINASAEAVWQALIDFPAHDDWDPMLKNIKASLSVGSPVSFDVHSGKPKPMSLKAKITEVSENNALAWRGGSVIAVSGTHYFRITPQGDGVVKLDHGEHFSGLLFPLLAGMIKKSAPLYEKLNRALKERVESNSTLAS